MEVILLTGLLIVLVSGCGVKEETTAPVTSSSSVAQSAVSGSPVTDEAQKEMQSASDDTVLEVDGTKMSRRELEKEVNRKFESIKERIPADKRKQVKEDMKRHVMNDFIVRTLLQNEVKRRGITSTPQEYAQALEQLKSSLPTGITLDDLVKKNRITREEMEREIEFGIKINKLVLSQTKKGKPTEREISRFYEKHRDKFKVPETVHVRHILIARTASDSDAVKAERREKAESVRKQLLEGADFAELAKKYSDCPSKESGGDLGILARGQTVKPFEDAAFSQAEKVIGPVVETEFGYHVIQVLEKKPARVLTLDEPTKERISAFLIQQRQQEAFESLVKNLRAKAHVVVYQ